MSTSSIIESGLLKSPTIMFNSLHFSQFCFLYFGPLLLGEYMLIIVTSLVAQMVKVSAYNVGEPGSIPGLGRSPGEENGNPLLYSCLENPMDGQRSLVGYSPRGHKESDTTERLHFRFLFGCLIF